MTRGGVTAGETHDTVELRIDARPENLALARLALAGVAARAGAPDEVVADLKLAVTEACTNAIQHAYRDSGESDEIVVRYTVGRGVLAIEVADSGAGFETDATVHERTRNEENQGLGLMIIGELTDELTVTSGSSGSRIAFAKRFGVEP